MKDLAKLTFGILWRAAGVGVSIALAKMYLDDITHPSNWL